MDVSETLTNLSLQEILFDTIHICERFRDDFSDYARLARISYSPWTEQVLAASKSFESQKPDQGETGKPSTLSRMKTKAEELRVASRWSLFDKKKLEAIVQKFRERNAQLSGTLQIAVAYQSRLQSLWGQQQKPYEVLRDDKDANILGFAARAERTMLAMSASSGKRRFNIENGYFEATGNASTVHMATLKRKIAEGNTTTETVLVEYKAYFNTSNAGEQNGHLTTTSPSRFSWLTSGTNGSPVFADFDAPIQEEASTRETVKARVNQLASILDTSGLNKLGTLPFKGLVHQPELGRHAFVFEIPEDAEPSDPISLHSIIESRRSLSLSTRFKIAQRIALSLGNFHADGWIHKGVRSQSVVFFNHREEETTGQDNLCYVPYLVNFEYSRPNGASSTLAAYTSEVDPYLHADLQGSFRPPHSKTHDIYSLGVILLEIAVWQTAKAMTDQSQRDRKRAGEPRSMSALEISKFYSWYAKRKIAHNMGEAYSSAVLLCLESKYKDRTGRDDFATTFNRDVIQKLSATTLR